MYNLIFQWKKIGNFVWPFFARFFHLTKKIEICWTKISKQKPAKTKKKFVRLSSGIFKVDWRQQKLFCKLLSVCVSVERSCSCVSTKTRQWFKSNGWKISLVCWWSLIGSVDWNLHLKVVNREVYLFICVRKITKKAVNNFHDKSIEIVLKKKKVLKWSKSICASIASDWKNRAKSKKRRNFTFVRILLKLCEFGLNTLRLVKNQYWLLSCQISKDLCKQSLIDWYPFQKPFYDLCNKAKKKKRDKPNKVETQGKSRSSVNQKKGTWNPKVFNRFVKIFMLRPGLYGKSFWKGSCFLWDSAVFFGFDSTCWESKYNWHDFLFINTRPNLRLLE